MSAPKRWLDETGSATRLERDLLRSGLSLSPPPDAETAVWAALVAQLPPPPGGAPSGGTPSGGTPTGGGGSPATAAAKASAAKAAAATKATAAVAVAAGGGILKSALIGAGSAVVLLTTYTVVTPSTPPSARPPTITATNPSSAPPVAPVGARLPGAMAPERLERLERPEAPSPEATAEGKAPEPRAAEPHSGLAPSTPRPVGESAGAASAPEAALARDRDTRLLEESQRLTEARSALRRGDAGSALGLLEELRQKFPGGVLVQEREALTIEALARSGRPAEAAARAEAFLKAYPSSPHAANLRAFTQ